MVCLKYRFRSMWWSWRRRRCITKGILCNVGAVLLLYI